MITDEDSDSPVGQLREYQLEGVEFLETNSSALLADEMGLGKTVQTLAALQRVLRSPGKDRSLIVAPASLTINWEKEIERWAPELSVGRVSGNQELRNAHEVLPYHVLIVSYEVMRLDIETLRSIRFGVVVLDEAQRIKNPDSSTAVAAWMLDAEHCWALTGTPVENSFVDIVSIFRFVKPGLLSTAFNVEAAKDLMAPHFLRRTKSEVLGELPPIIDQTLPIELSGQQKQAYDNIWRDRRSRITGGETSILALLTELKKVCNYDEMTDTSAKWEALEPILQSHYEKEHKLIVFSQYVKTIEWLRPRAAKLISTSILHGGQGAEERQAIIDRFNNVDGPELLIVSIKAGGVGINLNPASTVVLFDRWWNPATESQAIARAHRFGRKMPLHVIRFLAVDTVEERINEILLTKQVLFEDIVEGMPSVARMSLDKRELMEVLEIS